MKAKRKIDGSTLRNLTMTVLVVVFFVSVILAYYAMLRSETRERIIRSGELSAVTSAEQIDKYLSTGINAMKLACYTLDNMIRDDRSQEEIFDYILNQSIAITNITFESCPGLYGYINGEYMDGTGWIPDEGFVPMDRPWYVEARASIGRVAIVDPYVDLQTNTVMMSLSKTLCDAKSVVAVDFSMDQLQTITEKLAEAGESDMEIVLNRKYQVIAHSDRAEVGKDYAAEAGTFGAALVKNLRAAKEDSFSLGYGNATYIVYTVPVADEWLCLSVFDATAAFAQLRSTLAFTIISALLVVAVVFSLMARFNRKDQLAQQLTANLSQAKSDILEKDNRIGEISKVAFRDALTGVGSKAAFNQRAEELSREIAAGGTSLAVVMMDVNNLKYINDTFGHDAGDSYLLGCCKLICGIYKRSPVYRLGGDEFVAILQGDDYENRAALTEQFHTVFEQAFAREDKAPWERYTAAAGLADCETGDTSLDQALKRADKAMYAAKQAFKAKHGSYR